MVWFKAFWSINCYTFTCLILFYALLSATGLFPPLEGSSAWGMFLLTSAITVVILLADTLSLPREWMAHGIRLALIIAIVFGAGYLMDLFPFEPIYLLVVGAMNVFVYLGVFVLMFIQTKAEANEVNKQIALFKRQQGGDSFE